MGMPGRTDDHQWSQWHPSHSHVAVHPFQTCGLRLAD